MSPAGARTLLVVLTLSGIGWTIIARIFLSQYWTSSEVLRRLHTVCPQTGMVIMLCLYGILCDAMPGESRWFLLVVLIASYCLGHALWHF